MHARLDQPQPSPRPRLREVRAIRRRLRPPRHDPHRAQTSDQTQPLLVNLFFSDWFLSRSMGDRDIL